MPVIECNGMSIFCQAIRGGQIQSVEKFIKNNWPLCLDHKFDFDILLRRMTPEEDLNSNHWKHDDVDGGIKVGLFSSL